MWGNWGVAICDELLTDCRDSQRELLEAIKAHITWIEDRKIADALVHTQTEAHLVQLGTMTTHLTASRDNYRERLRRSEEGWESCIKTMSVNSQSERLNEAIGEVHAQRAVLLRELEETRAANSELIHEALGKSDALREGLVSKLEALTAANTKAQGDCKSNPITIY
jgi:t-SNARE complex subunit (syntaxin)